MYVLESSITKMSNFPRLIYRFNVIPIKIPAGFLEENDKTTKMYLEIFFLEKEKTVGRLTQLDFNT